MAILNMSLPDQLRGWVTRQVQQGEYSSACDYPRDLIRSDKHHQEQSAKWLESHLEPMLNLPEDECQSLSSDDIRTRGRKRLKTPGGDE